MRRLADTSVSAELVKGFRWGRGVGGFFEILPMICRIRENVENWPATARNPGIGSSLDDAELKPEE